MPLEGEERLVVFPKGKWFDLEKGESFEGPGQAKITGDRKLPPIFGRAGSLIPLARPQRQIGSDPTFQIDIVRFGTEPGQPFRLLACGGQATPHLSSPEWIELSWDENGKHHCKPASGKWIDRYQIMNWICLSKAHTFFSLP
jgi:alpha-D-xyloside xylohydrolase